MLQLATTPHVHTRQLQPQLFELTERDRTWTPATTADRILRLLVQFRYATPAMLAWAYETLYGSGASAVRHEITRLARSGLLVRFWQPVPHGSAPHVCIPTVAGARRVVSPEHWAAVRKQVTNRATRPLASYGHPVALALLEMVWRFGSEQDGTWRVARYATDRAHTFTVPVHGSSVKIAPDAVALMYHVRKNYYRPVLLEVDLVHRASERLRQRAVAYGQLLGPHQDVVRDALSRAAGVPVMSPMAVHLGVDAAHAERLRTATHDALELGTLFAARRGPDLWFAPLSALIGQAGTPIPPADAFRRELAQHVGGRQGRLLP